MEKPETTMNVSIRPATLSDVDIIAEFNLALAKETENLALNKERLMNGILSLLMDASKGFYLLAEFSGEPVGQLMITYEWSDWRNGSFWWIQSVFVRPEMRGKGVFTSLFQNIEERAKNSTEVCGLRLYVDHTNRRAQRTYERLGMTKSHYEMHEDDFVFHT
jgi:ribosomal protein S18 acetylase RimI-like enzyme